MREQYLNNGQHQSSRLCGNSRAASPIAAGLTDDDIDALIKRAQREVEPRLPR